jgi:hypothetical protein
MGRHSHGSTTIQELLRKVSDATLDGMAAVHEQPVLWPPSPVPRVPNDPRLALLTLPYRVPPEVERRAARLSGARDFIRLVGTATSMPRVLARAVLAQLARDRMGARSTWEIPGNYSDRR